MGKEAVARNDGVAEDEAVATDNEIHTEELGDGGEAAEKKKQR